tara:strand:- start:421 stop:1563 length:1143 start_codon:yes stop_codon:yes gene_type:complete
MAQVPPGTPPPSPVVNDTSPDTSKAAGGNEKRKCPKGQRWDPVSKTCVLIAEDKPKDEDRVFRSKETGEVSGVSIGGKTFLGIGPKDVERVLAQKAGKDLPRTAALEEAAKQREALGESTEEAAQVLGEAGAFEEVRLTEPREAEELKTDIPILSAAAAGFSQAVQEGSLVDLARRSGLFDFVTPQSSDFFPEKRKGFEEFPVPEIPETARELALRRIRIAAFEKGVSRADLFGSMIEAFPVAGGAIKAIGGGEMLQLPSSTVDNILGNINSIKEDASTGQEKVRNGLEDPDFGLSNARRMEEDLAQLEGKLHLFVSVSPNLQANIDEINSIYNDIFEAYEKVERYRRAASFGYTAELTGEGRVVPTDQEIFFELMELNK